MNQIDSEAKAKEDQELAEGRKKLKDKMGESTRLGGKGAERRRKKALHKTQVTDDKKLKQSMKKYGLQPLPQIEEVNLFKDDKSIIHIPKPEEIKELLPEIITQLGPKQLETLKDIIDIKKEKKTVPEGEKIPEVKEEDDDENEIPDLVGDNFEDYSKKEEKDEKGEKSDKVVDNVDKVD